MRAGYDDGPTEGDCDKTTALALRQSSSSKSIDFSGLPDQKTLFLLFH